MIIKLITSAIIVGCSTLIGMEMAKRYVLRTRQLQELQGALSRFDAEISHYSTRLPEAFKGIGGAVKGAVGEIFNRTGRRLSDTRLYTASEAWRLSMEEQRARLSFTEEEFDILLRFGDQLGSSHKEGQRSYIQLTMLQLRQQEQKAQELRAKYERMYKSLGLLGGCALAILLF